MKRFIRKHGNFLRSFSGKEFIGVFTAILTIISTQFFNCSGKKDTDRKMILSFYLDDTSPGIAGPEAYRTFLEFCKAHGIQGESSIILGYDGESMADHADPMELTFLEYARKSQEYGMDAHMEIMTHHELFDFAVGKMNESGIHEGLWLHEPVVTAGEYFRYFTNILDNGEMAGVKFTGLTWPGCGCEACSLRYKEMEEAGTKQFNPAVWEALMDLIREERFGSRVIPIFYDADETEYGIFQKAVDGKYGIYDLMPNVYDRIGSWQNDTTRTDPDYYISADGKSGILIRHLESGAPYGMWYMHWQGLNPENGVGWEAFKTVIERIEKHLSDRVVWMRPSEIVTRYHDADGWDFIEEL
jgi:hypothetical protein